MGGDSFYFFFGYGHVVAVMTVIADCCDAKLIKKSIIIALRAVK